MQGLHIILDLENCNHTKLSNINNCKDFLSKILELLPLNILGEIWHEFENKAFTANIALSDSHISIHTWPELNQVFFDVYLSCFKQNNHITTRKIADEIQTYFEGAVANKLELLR